MAIEKRLLSSTVGGAVSFVVSVLQSIVLVPVLLRFWGSEVYGTWLSLSALLMIVIAADIGFQHYLGNELCKCYAKRERDPHEFGLQLASGFRVAFFWALLELCLAVGLIGLGFLPSILGASTEIAAQEKLGLTLLVMVLGWIAAGSIGGILGSVYYSTGLLSRSIWIGVVVRTINLCIVGICAWRGGRLLMTAMLLSLTGLASLVFFLFDLKRRFREHFPFWIGGSWKVGWDSLKKSIIVTGFFISERLRDSGLLVGVSSSLGVAIVAVLATTRVIGNMLVQCHTIGITPFFPEMIRYDAVQDHEKLVNTWAAIWWFIGGLTNWSLLLLLLIVERLYVVWTHGELPFLLNLYLLAAWSVSLQGCNLPLVAYLRATNHLRAISSITITQTVAVLGLAVLLVKPFGLVGAGMALVAGELLGPTWLSRYFSRRKIRGLNGHFPATHDLCSLFATLFVGLVFIAVNYRWVSLSVAISFGSASLLMLYSVEWFVLPANIRQRLIGLLPFEGVKPQVVRKSGAVLPDSR